MAAIPYIKVTFSGSYEIAGDPSCLLGRDEESRANDGAGAYASWHWNGSELVIRNDPLGFYPLFYYASDAQIVASPSIPMLIRAGVPVEFDDDALAVFLRLGFFLQEDTPFRNIRALPPNARLVWSRRGWKIEGKRPDASLMNLSRRAALGGFIDLFRAAVQCTLPPEDKRAAVLLTGGRDSRHILCEILRIHRKPEMCVTVNLSTSNDSTIASAIASALSLPQLHLPETPLSVRTLAKRNLKTSFCSDEHVWILGLPHKLRGRVEYVYDGIAGDVLSNGLLLTPENLEMLRAGRVRDFAVGLVRHNAASRILAPEYARRWNIGAAIARIEQEATRHLDAPNPVLSFFFWNRTRREIALQPYAICRNLRVCAPYLHAPLVEFLSSLPAELFLDRRFHDEAIDSAFPEMRRFPYSQRHSFQRPGMRGLAWAVLCGLGPRRSVILNRSFLIQRLTRCLIDRRFASAAVWLSNLPVYALQLDRLNRPNAVREGNSSRVSETVAAWTAK